jgi:hypothetical protein
LQEEGWREQTQYLIEQGLAAIETMAESYGVYRRRSLIDEVVAELINGGARNEARR